MKLSQSEETVNVLDTIPGGRPFSGLNRQVLKSRLRPLVAAVLASSEVSSSSLENKVATLKAMLADQLPARIRDHILGKSFEKHATKLFLRASSVLRNKSTKGTTTTSLGTPRTVTVADVSTEVFKKVVVSK